MKLTQSESSRYISVLLAAVLILSLLCAPSSAYKNVLVWGAFVYLAVRAVRRRGGLSAGGLGLPIAAYLGVSLAAALFSIDRPHSLSQFAKLAERVVGFVVIATLLRKGNRSFGAMAAFAAAMAVLWLFDVAVLWANWCEHLNFDSAGRWFGSAAGFPTIAAGMYAPCILILAVLLIQQRDEVVQTVVAGAIGIGGLLLFFLQTRSVFLGIAAGLAVLLVLSPVTRKVKASILGCAVAAVCVGLLLSPAFRAKWASFSSSERNLIWKESVALIRQRPLLGHGFGHGIFEKANANMPAGPLRTTVRYDHAHNMLLEQAVQSGVLGLACFLWLIGCSAVRVLRRLPDARAEPLRRYAVVGWASALAVILVYGQFSLFFALTPALLFWSMLGALMAAGVDDTARPGDGAAAKGR